MLETPSNPADASTQAPSRAATSEAVAEPSMEVRSSARVAAGTGADLRLWVGPLVALMVLAGLGTLKPDLWPWMLGAMAVVGLATAAGLALTGAGKTDLGKAGTADTANAVSTHDAPADALPSDPPQPLLESLFEAMSDPVLVVAGQDAADIADRRVVLANSEARSLFRIERQGALLVSALRDPDVLEAVDEALFGLIGSSVAYTTGGPGGRYWKVMVRPLASTGPHSMAVVLLRDETDVRRMELMRVDFLANASHELKTPLASLAGFIETLKGHARDDPKARDKFLDIMAAQTQRMGRLVSDLLSLSRIELNEHIPPSGRVDLKLAASDVIDAISLLAQEREVDLKLQVEAGDTHVVADRDEVVQVIQNLVDNAIKYSSGGQTVDVLVQSDLTLNEVAEARSGVTRGMGVTRLPLAMPARDAKARYVAIAVRDHGQGLAREHLPRLTERFYRVEGQKSGERAGTGLGLAIVKHIVNRHRGGLTVESEPGQGTTFVAYFPMAGAARSRAPATD